MAEMVNKPEPPMDNTKSVLKIAILAIIIAIVVMILSKTSPILLMLTLVCAVISLVIMVAILKKVYQKSCEQYELDLQKYQRCCDS